MRRQEEVKRLGRYAIFSKRLENSSKSSTQSAAQQVKKIRETIDPSHETLLEVRSVFPFMLFQDSLKVDRQKVTITHRTFFRVAHIINIQIEDLQAIEAIVGPVFGTISITTKQFENTVNSVHVLSRRDVREAQSLLQGFILATKEGLDHSKIGRDKLVALLKELGREARD